MDQQFKQGHRMHCVFSNRNCLDVDRLDDAGQERIETARNLPGDLTITVERADDS